MGDGYALTTTLHRDDLVEWLEGLSPEHRDQQIEQALAVGYQVLTFVQAGASEESMNRFFQPVLTPMKDLTDKLNTMMTYSQKSQRLGELGEAMVASQLSDMFPRDRFAIVSSTGHQADVHAAFDLGDGVEQGAIIEVKLYSNDVPTKEIEKFRRDLRQQGSRYGLMVSLTSRLTGVTGPFAVEAKDDYVAVLVPNAGNDGLLLYWGATLLKSLMHYERRSGVRIQSEAIARAFSRLQQDLAELAEATRRVGSLAGAIRDTRNSVTKTLDTLGDQAVAAELHLKNLIANLEARLAEELNDLPRQTTEDALPPPADPDELVAFLDELDAAGDKRAPAFRALYQVLQDHSVTVSMSAGVWTLTRDGQVVAKTHSLKSRMDVQWHVDPTQPLTLDPQTETFKGDFVVINGKDAGGLASRVEARLAEADA